MKTYLYHHGIKGQRCGKRNGPPYPLDADDRSAEEKKAVDSDDNKRYNTNTAASKSYKRKIHLTDKQKKLALTIAVGAASIGIMMGISAIVDMPDMSAKNCKALINSIDNNRNLTTKLSKKLANTPISELSDEDSIIKAGTKFTRMTNGKSSIDVLKREKMVDIKYAAYNANDRRIYREMFHERKSHLLTMRTVDDLRLPSERKRVSVMMDLLNNSEFRDALSHDLPKYLPPNWSKTTGETRTATLTQKDYHALHRILGERSSKAAKMYMDALVRKGYTAITDDNDANQFAETPVILLDSNNDTLITGVRRLTEVGRILNGAFVHVPKIKESG